MISYGGDGEAMMRLLLKNGINIRPNVFDPNSRETKIFVCAVLRGHASIVRQLLGMGIDATMRLPPPSRGSYFTEGGLAGGYCTPLYYAARAGQSEIVDILLEYVISVFGTSPI